MKFQCLVIAVFVVRVESGFWSSWFGSQTRVGLEASAGFLRSAHKTNAPLRTAVQLTPFVKLDEPPVVKPMEQVNSSLSAEGVSVENASAPIGRNFAAEKWSEINSEHAGARKAAAEEEDLLNDESVRHKMSWEAMLISNLATGEDEHAQPCIAHCRYGEEIRHSWQECVERCVEDGITRRMLLVGLPERERAAVHMEAAVPPCIDALKKKKRAHKAARSAEL